MRVNQRDKKSVLPLVVNAYIRSSLHQDEMSLTSFIQELERQIIHQALRLCNGHKKNAAHRLGLKYPTTVEKIKKHRVNVDRQPYVQPVVTTPRGDDHTGELEVGP